VIESRAPLTLMSALPFMGGGGTERVVLALLRGLDRRRFAPHLILFERRGPLLSEIPGDVTVHALETPRLRRAALPLLRVLKANAPDVIFSTLGYLNLAFLALRPWLPKRPRLIIREPNTPSLSLPNLAFSRTLALGYRWLYPKADAIVCQSRWMAEELTRDFGAPKERIRLIANPVDVERLRARALPVERHPGAGPRFVAAGRLTMQKGFDRLIEIFDAAGPQAYLTLLGDGPLRESLKAQAEAKGLLDRIDFAGFKAEPAPYLAGADAFLLPSRWEGMPNAALEALALGTPVIGTPEAGGLSEVAEEAPKGAVTLARMEPDFAVALAGVRPKSGSKLPASLLPPRFALDGVIAAYADLLAGGGP